jgi:hypothetical protein
MARGTWGGALDPNIFRVNILFLHGTSKCQTGFKLRDVGVQDNTAQEVAEECRTQLAGPFRDILAHTDSLLGFDVLKLGTDEGGWAPQVQQAGNNIIQAADELPHFVACNVALKSEIRKRYGQGRMFLPLIIEDQISGNVLSAQGSNAMQNFVNVMIDHFTGDPATHDLLLVNAHDVIAAVGGAGNGSGHPDIPRSWYDVVSLRVNSIVTSLRSRKPGVGS